MVQKGDRVTVYMPMIPELPIALLACARIGAPHSVVFGGFSAESLRDRINDAQSKLVITADGSYRRGQIVPLKQKRGRGPQGLPLRREGGDGSKDRGCGSGGRWTKTGTSGGTASVENVPAWCEPEPMDSEDPLFILYTSGTTAKPKGILHTTGGYILGASLTHKWVFDAKEEDVYWCSADIGWVTGHSYIVYGPLANGTTGVLYEGSPDWPDKDRWWAMVAKYGVNVFYTAPTAIRAVMKWGESYPAKHDLSTLRLLGSVGEPINPEAWMWYHEKIGQGRCPIVDTWWQTETGSIMISPLPGLTTTKPGSATFPLPGIDADVVDEAGNSVPLGGGGYLVLKSPWPSMARTIYGDPKRYEETYWQRFGKNVYFAGDGCKRDEEGYFWLLGRVDDVMNISGHRLSTMEVESALVDHQEVAEAAVIGKKDGYQGRSHCRLRHLEGRGRGECRQGR